MNVNWQKISQLLKEVYVEKKLLDDYSKDESYLKNAFEKTECLWNEQLHQMSELKAIIISESPLFGKEQKYIYNTNTAPSSFFYYQDIEALPTVTTLPQKPKSIVDQKQIMLRELIRSGVLILDIFPFAFNKKNTSLHYRRMGAGIYRQLLKGTTENYLRPKLQLCLDKSNEDTLFIYRYKRLFDKKEGYFEEVSSNIGKGKYKVETINGKNMPMNREKLRELLSR